MAIPISRALPSTRVHFRAPRPVADAGAVRSRQRLIDAYATALLDAPPTSGIWSHETFKYPQQGLASALGRGDSGELVAELLASMFRSDFVFGMDLGNRGASSRSRFNTRVMRLEIWNQLVALAESLGAVRVENPEQAP